MYGHQRGKTYGRIAGGIAGASALMLLTTACGSTQAGSDGAGSDGSSGKKAVAAPAERLPLKASARKASWTDRDDETHELSVTPERLARGAAADLEHVELDKDLKGSVPYYLTVSYTNTGKAALTDPDPADNFSVTLADGTPGQQITLFNTNPLSGGSRLPKECRTTDGPDRLAPGGTAKVCRIVMLPEGRQPATVAYAEDGAPTLLWQVGDGKGDDDAGSLLPADRSATASWQDTDDHDVPMRVTPTSVRMGSAADLSRYDLSADQKKLVPYYVTFEYRNTGKRELLPMMQDGVGVRSAGGRAVRPLALIDFSGGGNGVDQCRGAVPNTRLKPKGTLTLCSIHMLPKGDHPAMVSFESEGHATRLTWRAPDATE